jgi:hypothetical protein
MQVEAEKLSPYVDRLERLLGYGLQVDSDVIKMKIDAAIERDMDRFGLQLAQLDTVRVDLRTLADAAINRTPPFDPGPVEKGFRDALILETVAQIVDDSPSSPASCRVCFLTGDDLLEEAARNRVGDRPNVSVVRDLTSLENFINILVANVTEEFVDEIKGRAKACFFKPEPEYDGTLVAREKVTATASSKFQNELEELPPGASRLKPLGWIIGNNSIQFLGKERQRVFWRTQVWRNVEAYRTETIATAAYAFDDQTIPGASTALRLSPSLEKVTLIPSDWLASATSSPAPSLGSAATNPVDYLSGSSLPSAPPKTREVLMLTGRQVFNVDWSVTVDVHRHLRGSRVDDVKFVGTEWSAAKTN